ncbi:MAG: PorP/SprF family type IX secretion system membrane protein [Bacteroidota bacterium]
MKTIKKLTICVFLFYGLNVFSQDPSFSQFYGNQTYFNPAFVGLHGGMMVNTTYRRQWLGVPSKFETYFVNFDSDISCINGLGGFGISAYKDIEGQGALTTQGMNLMLSTRLSTGRNSFFQLGAGVAILQKTIDWSKYTFSDQYDPLQGLSYPTSFNHPSDHTFIFPDMSFGLIWKYGDGPKKGLLNNNFDLKFSAAVQHITEPKMSFLGQETFLPKKFIFNINSNISLNRNADFIISPCIVEECQYPMSTIMFGYNLLWSETFFIGNWFRFNTTNTLSFTFGFNSRFHKDNRSTYDLFKFYYCYDLPFTGLKYNASGGSHELGIAYLFNRSLCSLFNLGGGSNKNRRIRRIPCPDPSVSSY